MKVKRLTLSGENLIEYASRVCHRSKGSDGGFIQRLIEMGHESVPEHASVTFEVVVSQACSHQIVRHRLASYSQESQRYVEDIEFVTPRTIAWDPAALNVYRVLEVRDGL